VVVQALVKLELALLDQIVGKLADVLRGRVTRIKLLLQFDREWIFAAGANTDQGIPEAISDTQA